MQGRHAPGSSRLLRELALVGIDMPTDVIVATPDEVARLQGVPGSIIRPALQEGRVVYERPV